MRVVIDRFEGNYAVCEKEDRTMVNIEKKKLPKDAKEGDVLVIDAEFIRIEDETTHRSQQIKRLMDELWK